MWPAIELEMTPASRGVKPGERIRLSWKVENAARAYLLQLPGRPFEISGLAVEWSELAKSGRGIDLEGEMELSIENSTTYVVAAVGRTGRSAKSIDVRVNTGKAPEAVKAKIWHHSNRFPRPEDLIDWERDRDLWHSLYCALVGPRITLSIDRCCLFSDEMARVEWEVTCANCCDMWTHALMRPPRRGPHIPVGNQRMGGFHG